MALDDGDDVGYVDDYDGDYLHNNNNNNDDHYKHFY